MRAGARPVRDGESMTTDTLVRDAATQFSDRMAALARRVVPGATGVEALVRLSGGASQETWAFSASTPKGPVPLILRRAPGGMQLMSGIGLDTEAELMRRAGAAGVPSPNVRHVLEEADGIGVGFVMDRVDGETLGQKIVRGPQFEAVRPQLAGMCGEIAAKIHRMPREGLDRVVFKSPAQQIDDIEAGYRAENWPRPIFELAFRWLRDRIPETAPETVLVHGDYRNGNIIFGPEGPRAVLDWELTHFGDPMEDLAWMCVPSWRFGEMDKPAGGFGTREELFAGYERAGGKVDEKREAFWEVFGALKWGLICSGATPRFRAGATKAVEPPVIARRASETEIDLMRMIAPRS